MRLFIFFLILIWSLSWHHIAAQKVRYESESLKIYQLNDRTFLHETNLSIPGYGNFPCNGLIYTVNEESVVFDAPSRDSVSMELIVWIRSNLNSEIKGIVVNHFHADCLGGLQAFHDQNIPSYALEKTRERARKDGATVPQIGFERQMSLFLGDHTIQNLYLGPGHTADNIVSYLSDENVLFGGCMIKSLGAGRGNLQDADTIQWPKTVQKIKENFPDLKLAVPGHGKVGGTDLLEYTIQMFNR